MYRLFFNACLIVLITSLLASCYKTLDTRGRLVSSVRDFSERVRWKDANGAAGYFKKEHREAFIDLFDDRDDLHIVGVSVDRLQVDEPGLAFVRLALEYYELPSVTVKKIRLKQQWVLEQVKKGFPSEWKIATPFPESL